MSFLRTRALATLVFSSLSAAGLFFILGHAEKSGLSEKLVHNCPVPATYQSTYQLAYTGVAGIDGVLCTLVQFFTLMLDDKSGSIFTIHFFAQFSGVTTLLLFESVRDGRPLAVASPALFGLMYQTLGGGVIVPLYWLTYILSGAYQGTGDIGQVQAESSLFGFLLGYAVPTVSMFLYPNNRHIVAAWQAFPLWSGIAQQAYILCRPTVKGSGYKVIQLTHFLTFTTSVVFHLGTHGPDAITHPLSTVANLFSWLPSIYDPDPNSAPIAAATEFLTWDILLISVSTLIAPLFAVESLEEGLGMVAWSVVSSVFLGPGAAISGVWMWKESTLEAAKQLKKKSIKTK